MDQDNGVSSDKLEILVRIITSKGISSSLIEKICNVPSLDKLTNLQEYYLEILLSYVDINKVIMNNDI